jgi:8-oxo-dGTP pyrophosphatase MutT (NUDIX family)
MKEATLIFLFRGDPLNEVLMGLKKEGFGEGKIVGFGGKIEPGETIVEAAKRELGEETGIEVKLENLKKVADLTFLFPYKKSWEHRVHVFAAHQWRGEALERDEMIPIWFKFNELPYDQMWDDGQYWLPHMLAGERVSGRFIYERDNQTVGDWEIEPLK